MSNRANDNFRDQLLDAIHLQDVSIVASLITTVEINSDILLDSYCEACQQGNEEIVYLLSTKLPKQNTPRRRDGTSKNPLSYACTGGNLNIVKTCYQTFFSVNLADNDGYRPLHFACQKPNADIVKFLLSKGANIISSKTFTAGFTPLHVAIDSKQKEVLNVLLESGRAGINERTSRKQGGYTPLHMAIMNDFIEGLDLLIEHGVDLTVTDITKKLSSLHFAAESNDVRFIQRLLSAGADPNTVCTLGLTLLHAKYP